MRGDVGIVKFVASHTDDLRMMKKIPNQHRFSIAKALQLMCDTGFFRKEACHGKSAAILKREFLHQI